MYSQEDSLAIVRSLKAMKLDSISYQKLVQFLLDFQLKSHMSFLSKFTSIFQSIDNDRNGILSRDEFLLFASTLIKNFDQNLIDCSFSQITYSESVSLLSGYLIQN
ncbi:hypothetical protein RCL1_003806 [Eukaryota sp. TZLM3-RCL]